MTLDEARRIIAKCDERQELVSGPSENDLYNDGKYVQTFLIDGNFTAEELEAIATVLRDAERRTGGT